MNAHHCEVDYLNIKDMYLNSLVHDLDEAVS